VRNVTASVRLVSTIDSIVKFVYQAENIRQIVSVRGIIMRIMEFVSYVQINVRAV
jgi:hypothetical protein